MTNEEKISAAYETTKAFEQAVVADYSNLVDAFNASVTALMDRFPANGKSGPVYQCVSQGMSLITTNSQLQNLKFQFGLATPVQPIVPTNQPVA